MPTPYRLSLITPGATKFEGEVEIVIAPGAAGDLGVLANHAPLLTTLRAGVVSATTVAGGEAKGEAGRVAFAVEGGFMQVLADKVIILTDAALSPAEVNIEEARADLRRAEGALGQKRDADDSAERRALAWAQARLDVTARPM